MTSGSHWIDVNWFLLDFVLFAPKRASLRLAPELNTAHLKYSTEGRLAKKKKTPQHFKSNLAR